MVYARVGCGEWRVGGGWGRGATSILSILGKGPLSLSGALSMMRMEFAYRCCLE